MTDDINNRKRDASILRDYESGMTYTDVGKLYGLSRSRVQAIVYKQKYRPVNFMGREKDNDYVGIAIRNWLKETRSEWIEKKEQK
jgi:hypothetical protein